MLRSVAHICDYGHELVLGSQQCEQIAKSDKNKEILTKETK